MFRWPKRFTPVVLCFFAAFLAYSDRVNLSVAVIQMQAEFNWTETTKGLVLSSFFIGYLLFLTPGGWLANRYGGKIVLGIAVIWWSLFTALTPIAAMASMPLLIAARILLGLGEAASFPATWGMFSRWIPAHERSRAVSFVSSGAMLGTLFALLVTGWIVTTLGWPMAFYSFGAAGLIWAVFWFIFIYEYPHAHPSISGTELKLLDGLQRERELSPVPWKALLSHPAVWALFFNHFCTNWSLYMFLAWLPSYFKSAQSLSLTSAGIYSMAPWLSMAVMLNVAGWIADWMIRRGQEPNFVRKLMQIGGLLGSAVFLLLCRDADSAFTALVLLCAALGALACCYSGFGPNSMELAPRHADVLFGMTNTFATIPGIIGVAVTGWLVDISGSYDSAFLLAASISIVGAIVWYCFASSRPVVA